MISAIIRTALVSLRRDRGALALSFILPVVFFSIFAMIFGGRRDTTPRVTVLVVDEDHSRASQRLFQGLKQEGSLVVKTRPEPVKGTEQPEYTAVTAEAAVKKGSAPVALIIPHGFGENPIAFGPSDANRPTIQLLEDSSDIVAPQMIAGLLQKVAITAMPDVMAEQGSNTLMNSLAASRASSAIDSTRTSATCASGKRAAQQRLAPATRESSPSEPARSSVKTRTIPSSRSTPLPLE